MWKKRSSSWENGNHNGGGEWRKVISTLAKIILEHGKYKKRNSSILILMQQHLLTSHCREYKMDILNITGTTVRASFSGEAIICLCLLRPNITRKSYQDTLKCVTATFLTYSHSKWWMSGFTQTTLLLPLSIPFAPQVRQGLYLPSEPTQVEIMNLYKDLSNFAMFP